MNTDKYVDINNTRGEEMYQKWLKIIEAGVDPFDPDQVEKWIGGKIILQTDHCYAFENDHTYDNIEHQIVIVTKQFFDDSYDLPDEVWLDLKNIKNLLRGKYGITGGGFVMRFGDTSLSGGSVVHLHAQLIVPKEGEQTTVWLGSKKKNEKNP